MKTTEYNSLKEDSDLPNLSPSPVDLSTSSSYESRLFWVGAAAGLPSLDAFGFQMTQVQDLQNVLEEVKLLKPDLVLMDTHLEGLDSFETCQRLKSHPETDTIPVIFIDGTASPPQGDTALLVKGMESGANDFFHALNHPRELLARIQNALKQKQIFAKSDALAIHLTEMNTELYERNVQVEKELHVTRQLQQSLLPPSLPEDPADISPESLGFVKYHHRSPKLRISGVYLPCDALGGDLYDVIQFNEDTIGVTIADVSGHGVPAAFVTAMFKAAFYRATHTYEIPGEILFHLNNELYNIVKTGEYVTCIYCRILDDGTCLEYSGAGHPYPMFYHAKQKSMERLKENGTPLVWIKDMEYPNNKVALEPGDRILIFTDGISEIKNVDREMFGEPALEELFERLIHEHPRAILDKMIEALSDFTQGYPLEDDMSIVLIEVLEETGA